MYPSSTPRQPPGPTFAMFSSATCPGPSTRRRRRPRPRPGFAHALSFAPRPRLRPMPTPTPSRSRSRSRSRSPSRSPSPSPSTEHPTAPSPSPSPSTEHPTAPLPSRRLAGAGYRTRQPSRHRGRRRSRSPDTPEAPASWSRILRGPERGPGRPPCQGCRDGAPQLRARIHGIDLLSRSRRGHRRRR